MTIQPPQQFTARLKDKNQLNEKFTLFQFEVIAPHKLSFKAGQYVSLKVSDTGERRSYSIFSSPEVDHEFDLLVDLSPSGVGCQFLQTMTFGQEVHALAPLGVFTVPEASESPEQQLVFIATGSGFAPFWSMLADQLQLRADMRPVTLYWGMRHERDLCWIEDIENMTETFSHFSFYPVLSQATQAWNLSRGRVTDVVRVHQFASNTGFYLCGNQAMIEDMTKILTEEKQVPKQFIHHEKFF